MSWRRLPGSRRIVVGPHDRRRATGALALAGASDWRRVAIDRLGALALAVPALMPRTSAPDWPRAEWDHLSSRLGTELPGLRVIAAVLPRQAGRARLSLLAHFTGNDAIVKLDRAGALDTEHRALTLLDRNPLPGITTPEPLAAGTVDVDGTAVGYLVTTSISLHRQRAAIDEPLRSFERDLAERLAALPRHDGLAADAVPVHGDLTPWNLRRTSRGLALFDWESAGWGTPGSDLAQYRRACDDVRRPWQRARRRETQQDRR